MSHFFAGFEKCALKAIPVAKVLDYGKILKETSKTPVWKRKMQEAATNTRGVVVRPRPVV